MDARTLIICFYVFRFLLECVLNVLSDRQRSKPLPENVADVYSHERYRDYLSSVADYHKAWLVYKAIDFLILVIVLYSGFFGAVESVAGENPYLVLALTLALFVPVSVAETVCLDYYSTLIIDERYGVNRSTKRDFAKDETARQVVSTVLVVVIMFALAFFGERIPVWTQGFTTGSVQAGIICAIITAAVLVLAIFSSALSLLQLRVSYTIEPLPDGELRERLFQMAQGSKRKLRQVYVYNESAKSTEENAALISIPGHCTLVIADNLIESGDTGRVLATLSHEIGHLKQRCDGWTIASGLINAALVVLLFALVLNPGPIVELANWTQSSFGLSTNNYFLILSVLMCFAWFITAPIEVYNNCKSRAREYRADQEAVMQGLGQQLVDMLKGAERKVLANVNPHPVIEFLEYDHPGLARRVSAIQGETASG